MRNNLESPPRKGTRRAERTSSDRMNDAEPAGEHALFVLAREGSERLESPVWEADEGQSAVAVFTDRNLAFLYLQASGWDRDHRPQEIAPIELGEWTRQARERGIRYVVVNPNYLHQNQGAPQMALDLNANPDQSGEALYQELRGMVGA